MNIVQIHPAVHRIETPFGGPTVYLYLLKGERLALVDTGVADSPRLFVEPALAQIGLKLSDLGVILNTHAHADHTGGNHEIKRASNASVHIHAADLDRGQSMETMVEFALAPFRALEVPQPILAQREEMTRTLHCFPSGGDVVVSDGDRVDLGGGIELTVIHTPGHTPGSVSYYWEREGVLLTGDGVQGQGSENGKYPFYFDAAGYRRTLTRVSQLDLRLLCVGHSYIGGTDVNYPTREGEQIAPFLKESIRVADAFHAAAAKAVERMPDASMRETVLATLPELRFQVPQLLMRETGMPWFGGPSLLAHIQAVRAGTYPGGN